MRHRASGNLEIAGSVLTTRSFPTAIPPPETKPNDDVLPSAQGRISTSRAPEIGRRGRACPGDPRLVSGEPQEGVDARHQAGHDE
jgi:hypothetical protein